METRKLKILVPVTPPGFSTAVLCNDVNGNPVKMERLDICKVGDVIELPKDLAERYIQGGIAAPASAAERVTKKPNYGAFENAESGPEKQNPVSTEANANNV